MPTPIVEGFSLTHAQICDGTTTFIDALVQSVSQGLDIYGVNEASLEPDSDSYENQGDDTTLSRWNWMNFATLTVQGGYLSMPLLENLQGTPIEEIEGTVPGSNEVQTISASGATEGTFTLSFGGQITEAIAFDADAAAVQSALTALSSVGENAAVAGGPASTSPLTVTFSGSLGNKPQPTIGVGNAGLTGGSHTVQRTTPGTSGNGGFAQDLWHEDSFNTQDRPGFIIMPSKDHMGEVRRLVIGLYKLSFGPIGFDGPAYKDGLKVNYEATALMSEYDETGARFEDGKKRVGRLLSVA